MYTQREAERAHGPEEQERDWPPPGAETAMQHCSRPQPLPAMPHVMSATAVMANRRVNRGCGGRKGREGASHTDTDIRC